MKTKGRNIKRRTTPSGIDITFTAPYSEQLDKWLDKNINKQEFIDIELGKKKIRSNDANSYFWTLCQKIADKTRQFKNDVYRELVKEVGVFEDIAIIEEAAETFKKKWESNGIGWIVTEEPCKLKGCVKYRCYSGSSVYTPKEMARLIDKTIDEAQALGIETKTPDEIAELKEKWRGYAR